MLYVLLTYLLAPVVIAMEAWKALWNPEYRGRLSQRFGLVEPQPARRLPVGARGLGRRGAGGGRPGAGAADAVPGCAARDHDRDADRRAAGAHAVRRLRCRTATCPTTCRARCGVSSTACGRGSRSSSRPKSGRPCTTSCGRRGIPLVLASARISTTLGRSLSAHGVAVHARRCRTASSSARRARRMPSASVAIGADAGARARHRQHQVRLAKSPRPRSRPARAFRATLRRRSARCGSRAARTRARRRPRSTRTPRCAQRASRRAAGAGAAPSAAVRGGARAAAQAGLRVRAAQRRASAGTPDTPGRSWSTRSASCSCSTRRRTSRSSAAAWCRSAGTTCSSRRRSACRCSPGPHTYNAQDIAETARAGGALRIVRSTRGTRAARVGDCFADRRSARARRRARPAGGRAEPRRGRAPARGDGRAAARRRPAARLRAAARRPAAPARAASGSR